jgi:PAS domain S-box-containing protein
MNSPGLSCFSRCIKRLVALAGLFSTLCVSGAFAAQAERSFLTAHEQSWLDTQSTQVRIAPEANYPPFSFMASDAWQGLSADMIGLLQDRSGAKFQTLPSKSLAAIHDDVKLGNADIVTSLQETPERAQYLSFTQPYFRVPTAILVKTGFAQGRWPDLFVNKRVAVGRGYGVQKYLEHNFPAIKLTLVTDDLEGMRKLSFGEVDAVIMDVASASFFIEREKFTNLRLWDAFDYTYDLRYGVRKDLPILRDILSKTLEAVPDLEKKAILDKWINISPDPYAWLRGRLKRWFSWAAGVLGIVLLGCALVWRTQRHRRQTEHNLAQYSRSLIEASLDPLVTISAQGKITDVNTATEQVTGVVRSVLVGSDFADYFTDPLHAREGYLQVFAKGSVTDYPLAIRHTSGKITDVLYNASVYRDDAGEVLGVFAAARDVTEHNKAQAKLQEGQSELEEAQRIAHLGSWRLDIETNHVV